VNSTQIFLLVSYSLLMVASVVFVLRMVRSTRERERRKGTDVEHLKERESRYAWVVVALLAGLLVVTAFAIPYSETEAKGGQVVEVTAFQFGWTLEPATVTAGEAVEFRLRGRDVQHGFGVYDGAKLLAQVQVPAPRPGSPEGTLSAEQRLVHTFDEPGTYDVLCLEFCGRNHHKMAATLEVEE
jgi:cytochrome c oxidase subunit II